MSASNWFRVGGLYALLTVRDASITWAFYFASAPKTGHVLCLDHQHYECKAQDAHSLAQDSPVLLVLVGRAVEFESSAASPVCYANELEFEHVVLDGLIRPLSTNKTEREWWVAAMEVLQEEGSYLQHADLMSLANKLEKMAMQAVQKDISLTVINDECV